MSLINSGRSFKPDGEYKLGCFSSLSLRSCRHYFYPNRTPYRSSLSFINTVMFPNHKEIPFLKKKNFIGYNTYLKYTWISWTTGTSYSTLIYINDRGRCTTKCSYFYGFKRACIVTNNNNDSNNDDEMMLGRTLTV